MKPRHLVLQARPRVAPLGWPFVPHPPHPSMSHDPGRYTTQPNWLVVYSWVTVKPDGSGWTAGFDPTCAFPETELDDVLERFYESAGPYPFDFQVTIVPYQPRSKTKAKSKTKRTKRKTPKRGRT